jgi:hypothetical protein
MNSLYQTMPTANVYTGPSFITGKEAAGARAQQARHPLTSGASRSSKVYKTDRYDQAESRLAAAG